MNEQNEIVLYQPDSTLSLQVTVNNEMVWLTQEQIAQLFGTKRPAITKHLNNIYECGELDKEGTCSILEHMGNDGKQLYKTTFIIWMLFCLSEKSCNFGRRQTQASFPRIVNFIFIKMCKWSQNMQNGIAVPADDSLILI